MLKEAAEVLENVRTLTPLIQCITNYVTINDCANILLAFGASPAMVEAEEEARGFAKICRAVYLNLGTLTKEQAAASVEAARGAAEAGIPVIVDPAGCGAVPRKQRILDEIAAAGTIALIKGNLGEIKVLAGLNAKVRGVDSADDEGAEEAVSTLARKYGCVVEATGKVDVISDGTRMVQVLSGVEMLTRITGAGCMLGALCAATAAVSKENVLLATATASLAMAVAGELAFEQAEYPGSFRVALMDNIYRVDGTVLQKRGQLVC